MATKEEVIEHINNDVKIVKKHLYSEELRSACLATFLASGIWFFAHDGFILGALFCWLSCGNFRDTVNKQRSFHEKFDYAVDVLNKLETGEVNAEEIKIVNPGG